MVNCEVYLLIGTNIDILNSQLSLKVGETVTFSSKEVGILIIKPYVDNPFV